MKISISYPPLESKKGVPLLSQNRQFQWFNKPTYIYPMIPAYAASLLKLKGYEVFWDDAIAEELKYEDWLKRIIKEKPDLIAIETKTPTVKRHWKIISELKIQLPKSKVVLMGDHITAFPEESLQKSNVDYCLKSGDYDFSLLSLAEHLNKGNDLGRGWYFKTAKGVVNTGEQNLREHDLNSLPDIDRELTKWKLYAYENGNFKYTPGTYTMAGRDCWWGKCTFCSWTTFYPGGTFRTISPEKLLDDIEKNIIPLGVKEVFDDTGCFPAGGWLKKFCQGLIDRGLNKKIAMSFNMRFGALTQEHYDLMAQANCRFILYGVESANQETIQKLDKNIDISKIEGELKMVRQANKKYKGQISPHVTTMIGYPWESYEEAKKTIEFTKDLFKKGLIETLQATVVMPYPGTPLFKQADADDNLLTKDWDRYDMREAILKTQYSREKALELTQGIYKSFLTPRFVLRKVASIRSWKDVKFLWMAGWRVVGHLLDFKVKDKDQC